MNIDTGLAVVVAAILLFYLRLIILQRERVKRVRRELEGAANKPRQKKGAPAAAPPGYSILSKNRTDRVIGGIGALAMIFGMLLNANVIQATALQPYWWIPTALGIVAFSWAFKL